MEIRQAISLYLTAKAYNDTEFKVKFENPNKNLDECVTYVTYKVYEKVKKQAEKDHKQMACAIPSDDEVFALAEQYYYDSDLLVTGSMMDNLSKVQIVSASATSFTDEEKEKMREDAIKEYKDKVIAEQRKKDLEKKNKGKDKKPTAPVIVPDTPQKSAEPTNKEVKQETAQQLSLF